MYSYIIVIYYIILIIAILYAFYICSRPIENFVQFCSPPKITIDNQMCFPCKLFYDSALQDLNINDSIPKFIQSQTTYINNVFNKIDYFIKNRATICNPTNFKEYIDCFKKYTSFVECPVNINKKACKFNDEFTELLISKASICVSKNDCKNIENFEQKIIEEFNMQKELFTRCYNLFTIENSPCVKLYADFIKTRVNDPEKAEYITKAKLDEELNKIASYAFQVNNY